MKSQSHSYFTKVLTQHLDALGHVNHAQYLVILEAARWKMLQDGGLTQEQAIFQNVAPVILEVHIKYRKEIMLHDELKICSEMTSYFGKIGTIQQTMNRVMSDSEEPCAVAELKFGLMDLSTRKLIKANAAWFSALHVEER